jgi:hypothetical protein
LGDVTGAREQSHEAAELAKDSGFPPAAVSARLDLLYLDLLEGDVGAAELAIPDLVEALEGTKGFHQWLWSIRLATARAEAALLAGHVEEAAEFARDALDESERIGRRKYVCRARTALGRAQSGLRRHEEAATSLQTAASEAEALGHLPSQWSSLASLATARAALGDDHAAQTAAGAARAAVETFGAGLDERHRDLFFARPEVLTLRS